MSLPKAFAEQYAGAEERRVRESFYEPGMSRHLWVATHVLSGILARWGCASYDDKKVQLAWEYADNMIAEEERREGAL